MRPPLYLPLGKGENRWNQAQWVHTDLEFAWVLNSPYRLDIPVVRNHEARIQSFAYVFDVLAVLSLAHVERAGRTRIISFRKASAIEREMYHEWLENDFENRP